MPAIGPRINRIPDAGAVVKAEGSRFGMRKREYSDGPTWA